MLHKKYLINLKKNNFIDENEINKILILLNKNGFVVIKNFYSKYDLHNFVKKANESLVDGYNAGYANFASLRSVSGEYHREFHHPFYISKVAVSTVLSRYLNKIISSYLDFKPMIHHALFRKTLPGNKHQLDWHIDLGSNKTLNKSEKFKDKRLRMIVYLNKVKSGGLNYIVESHKNSVDYFFHLLPGELFPKDKVPNDKNRKVHITGDTGDLILFDTHGLHKPGKLLKERVVFNVWFCRKDFKGKIPPNIIDVGNIDESLQNDVSIFSSSFDYSGNLDKKRKSLIERLYGIKKLFNL